MSTTEYGAANIIGPLKNATGFAGVAELPFNTTTTVYDLSRFFGPTGIRDPGHYYTFVPDGTKAYIALGQASGAIFDKPTASGSPSNVHDRVCYPVPDGVEKHFRMVSSSSTRFGQSGTASGLTGNPTGAPFCFLHVKSAATGGGTGIGYVYRSSLAPAQDVGLQFKGP